MLSTSMGCVRGIGLSSAPFVIRRVGGFRGE